MYFFFVIDRMDPLCESWWVLVQGCFGLSECLIEMTLTMVGVISESRLNEGEVVFGCYCASSVKRSPLVATKQRRKLFK